MTRLYLFLHVQVFDCVSYTLMPLKRSGLHSPPDTPRVQHCSLNNELGWAL